MGFPFFSRTEADPADTVDDATARIPVARSAPSSDLYTTLGVPSHASQEEIRATYRTQATALIDRWWLPGRAERQLAKLNSAYEILGHPSRRAEYDVQVGLGIPLIEPVDGSGETGHDQWAPIGQLGVFRHARRSRGRGTGLLDAIVIVFVVGLALGTASLITSAFSPNLSGILDLTETWGLTPKRRTPSADTRPKPQASPEVLSLGQPTAQPPPTSAPPSGVERYAGTQVDISDPNPQRRTDVTVTIRLVRDAQPLEGALTYLMARYRTAEERWPQGTATVRSDASGVARISFNIGDATAQFPVPVEVVTLIDGQQFSWRTQFIPR